MTLWPLLALCALGARAETWRVLLEEPLPGPLPPALYDDLLEQAAAMAPASATAVEAWAYDSAGILLPLESFLPAAPPVPSKDPPRHWSTHPADNPGAAEGALRGKAVYLSQCHGWIWYDSLNSFSTQRGNNYDTVEDFHNTEAADQYLVRYLENAGAAVFTVKERDMQPLMAIADNDGQGYTEQGSGFQAGSAGFADQNAWAYGEDPFDNGTTRRFPADGGGSATWTPAVPQDDWYAVYISWDAASDNATDAHYRLTHPGGVIDRSYDQSVHGSTWQYVEHLWLAAGTSLQVELLADSAQTGRYVSADAVRIGGGMGDVYRHGENTGRPRWEEGAILATQWNGAPTSVYDPYDSGDGSDPSSRSRWAAWEHPEGEDAVYLSWHSNACDYCGANGTSTYIYEGTSGDAAAGSLGLATLVQDALMETITVQWDPDWSDRGVRSAAFSEVNPSHNPEMPAALVELAFHDSEYDVSLLKEPDFRRDAARAMYRGIVAWFAEENGEQPQYLPEPPDHLAVTHDADGHLQVSWMPGPSGAPWGDAPSAYQIYTSADGRSWDGGSAVTGTVATLQVASGETIYVRVVATNAGGQSFPSEVVGARRGPEGANILVVSAFDRLQASTLVWEDVGGAIGEVVRMFLTRMNSYDTSVAHGQAIAAAGYYFDTVSDEAFDQTDLAPYDLVVWVAGEESTHDSTFTTSQQERLRQFNDDGGSLWVSGAEVLWDLDYKGSDDDQTFAAEVLGAGMAADDAGTTQVDGQGLLAGLVLDFAEDDGAPYPVEYPDVLDTTRPLLATYAGGEPAAALGEAVALFGFPFECIGDPDTRAQVAALLLPALLPGYVPPDPEIEDTGDSVGPAPPGVPVPFDETGCGCGASRIAATWLWLPCLLAVRSRRRLPPGLAAPRSA